MLPKQKSLFSEKAADLEVINSLLREISKLKGEVTMSKVIKSDDGKLYLVHQYEEIDELEATELLKHLQADVDTIQSVVNPEPATPEQPAEAPAEPEQPAEPTPPVDPKTVDPNNQPAPADQPAPAEQPSDSAAPADTTPAPAEQAAPEAPAPLQ